jgi:protoheme IX farnesyltransferase
MFAVEGTGANLYLLSLARKFQNDKTNANARKVFLCSLWYLPVLLAAYVFHSRMWLENNNVESTDKLTEVVSGAKEVLKGYCVHEIIAYKPDNNKKNLDEETKNIETNSSHLCMKKAVDVATEAVVTTTSKEIPTLIIKKENNNDHNQ